MTAQFDIETVRAPRKFIGRWLCIEDKNSALIRFNHWTQEQKRAQVAWEDQSIRLLIFLKARQVMMSTQSCGNVYHRHYSARGPHRTLIATDHNDTTDSMMGKFKVFDENMPQHIREQNQVHINKVKNTIEFTRTHALIKCLTVGGGGLGKGWTYKDLVAEEMAFWQRDRMAWGSINAAVSKHGRKVIISTPNGPGNLYEEQVRKAHAAKLAGDEGVAFFFFPWFEHHGYRMKPANKWEPAQEEATMAALFGLDTEQLYWRYDKIHGIDGIGIADFRKHYPSTIEEGFLLWEGGWFDVDYLNTLLAIRRRVTGEFRTYLPPRKGEAYAIGVDPSWCNGGDYSVAQVLDRGGRQCATLSVRRGGTDSFARRVSDLATLYNGARVLVEANPGGGGANVIAYLDGENVHLWNGAPFGKQAKHFTTSKNSKAEVFGHLRQQVNGDALDLYDVPTIQEMTKVREIMGRIANHSTGPDEHDDHTMALALAEWNRKTLPGATAEPRKQRRRYTAPTNPHTVSQGVLR